MERIQLKDHWKGECVGRFTFDTTVPCCTINNLIENGYLPKDLLTGKNADAVQEFEKDDWVYTTTFNLDDVSERSFLRFQRIDTYADVFLNDVLLAHVENGNIEHVFDVSTIVAKGKNTLKVCLFSPITPVEDLPRPIGAFTTERVYTRREQCTYGWDWVARFVCCGIGETELITYRKDEPIVDNVYVFTESIQSCDALLRIEANFKYNLCKPVSIEILSQGGNIVFEETVNTNDKFYATCATVNNADLWYPIGYGKQPLYTLRIKDGSHILHEEKFGIRTVELIQTPDEKDGDNYRKCLQIKNPNYDFNEEFSCFTVAINGVKIMCKGANWVPCQPYRMDGREEKISQLLALGVEMGLNMLRVWGGGSFECKHFYNECSRLGILVTQDFLMACAEYPEKEEWFLQHLQKEAEYACLFMRNQPCLVWYTGDNENAANGSFEMEDYTGKTAFEKGLKPVVERLDRTRDFLASSPYGGDRFASNTVGTTHNSQFLCGLFDYFESRNHCPDYKEEFKKYRARFIVEEPIFGAVSLPTLQKFMTNEEIFSEDTDMWLYHTKGNPSLQGELLDCMLHFTERVLGTFKDPYDRYFKSKYFQYEWVRIMLEQARREKWFCSGVIFWMFNDCWTAAAGWALIDYFNIPKLAYYAFKRCAQPLMCSLDYENGKHLLYVSNDSLTEHTADVEICQIKCGNTEKTSIVPIVCPANSTIHVELPIELADDEILIADLHSSCNDDRAFYKHGDLCIVPIENAVDWYESNGEIVLTAHDYVHAVELVGEAVFTDNGFSMKKGEQKRIGVRYSPEASSTQINLETYTLNTMKSLS